MRDRLIELILYTPSKQLIHCDRTRDKKYQYAEAVADYLLANGVIVPPCKVGDTLYEVIRLGCARIREVKVVGFHLGKFPDLRGHKRREYIICYSSDYPALFHYYIDKIGETIFLTKEEAEQALKGGTESGISR